MLGFFVSLIFVAETEGQAFEASDEWCLTAGFDFLATFLATFAGAADGPVVSGNRSRGRAQVSALPGERRSV
jgi:hypothetical protein